MKLRIKSMIWNTRKQQTATQNKKTKYPKNVDSINTLWDNFKRSNILIIEVPEGEEKEQEIGNLSVKIVKEHFLNLVKEIDMQVQEAQRVPNKMNAMRPTSRQIIIKMPKVKNKERLLKAAREKKLVTYWGVHVRLSTDFSKETLQARRGWKEVFKVMKIRDRQPWLLYPTNYHLEWKGR